MLDAVLRFLEENPWLVVSGGVIFLLWLVKKIFGAGFYNLLRAMHDECRDFVKLKLTPGAMNFLIFIFLLAFGVFIILLDKSGVIVEFVISYIGEQQAKTLESSMDMSTLFFALAVVAIVSILSTLRLG